MQYVQHKTAEKGQAETFAKNLCHFPATTGWFGHLSRAGNDVSVMPLATWPDAARQPDADETLNCDARLLDNRQVH
jgi:hypothetical protein